MTSRVGEVQEAPWTMVGWPTTFVYRVVNNKWEIVQMVSD